MFKFVVVAAILSVAFAAPAPKADPKPEPKPGFVAAAYTAPVVAAPVAAAYTSPVAYTAPLAYTAPVVYNAGYSAGYTAYSPYTGSFVVV